MNHQKSLRKIWIFAGTTEGRILTSCLRDSGAEITVSVATEYGKEIIPESEHVTVLAGRLDSSQMEEKIRREGYELILDATHPFARVVSEEIRKAAEQTGIPCVRVLREKNEDRDQGNLVFPSVEEAVRFLENTKGNILITTGSKELKKFTVLEDYRERCYARVLSMPNVVRDCSELGFYGEHLMAMQGPFSYEMNLAMIKAVRADFVVTKESGHAGGFEEKELAARAAGASLVVIGRPEEEGLSLSETLHYLEEEKGLYVSSPERKIFLIGAGPEDPSQMTEKAGEHLRNSDLIIGSVRMLQKFSSFGKPCFTEYRAEPILSYLLSHPEYETISILFSGDTGFYSGAGKVYEKLTGSDELHGKITMEPGISSMNYFFSRIGERWDDAKLLSLHGAEWDLAYEVKTNRKVFFLAGGKGTLKKYCEDLIHAGLPDVTMQIGSHLSGEKEEFRTGTPRELCDTYDPELYVCLVRNPEARKILPVFGLDDEMFLRDQVPMTKREVRTISISRLKPDADSVIYDIGAGTGSVSVECAMLSSEIQVYAIEKNPEAVKLLYANRDQAGLKNMTIIENTAPLGMEELPAPTHVFIGGSSGKMKEIVECALSKNPRTRFVINVITLESISQVMKLLKELPVCREDIIEISAARAKKAGPMHLMMGQNPVYIISFEGNGSWKGEDPCIRK